MSVEAFTGPAGTGKTYQLIQRLRMQVQERPLHEHQRVLAITFMHGARRRLDAKLRAVQELARRVDCSTIDSFSMSLVQRWHSLATALRLRPPEEEEFDVWCEHAATLLGHNEVVAWVGAKYPTVLVDEAQDLNAPRLEIVRALARSLNVLIAYDGFQCLDLRLRPNPLEQWMEQEHEPTSLVIPQRTHVAPLLAAALALRNGEPPVSEGVFKIMTAPSVPMAAALLANAIAWQRNDRPVAVLTPALAGAFTENVVARVAAQACGRQGNGPYSIAWEGTEQQILEELLASLTDRATGTIEEWIAEAKRIRTGPFSKRLTDWLRRQASIRGLTQLDRQSIVRQLHRDLRRLRQYSSDARGRLRAMTVHQAKNREFDGVFVVWPFQVGGDAEHKRRLLYNAVTRAQRWCTVVVQGARVPAAPPFSI